MRESERTTTWTCDMALACGATEVLDGGYQDCPPSGWRIVHVLPRTLNTALACDTPGPRKLLVLCTRCFGKFEEQTGGVL